MSNIEKVFQNLKKDNKKALITYSVAGDPDLESSEKIIRNFISQGVDIIEVGVPFSDPMAEGPSIQLGHERALKNKISLLDIMQMCLKIKRDFPNTPLVLMGYMNNFLSLKENLFDELKKNKIDGLIIVDLPYVESNEFLKKLNDKDIDLIRLISPTTTKERIDKILTSSSGYLYYISLKGVTGSELKISDELENRVLEIKKQTKLPVVVGFGIKDAKTAKKMSLCSDGVVVGSKLVDEIGSFDPNKENILNQNLTSIISDLKEGIS